MIRFLLFPLILFANPKALHITFHNGCAGEMEALCTANHIDVDTWIVSTLPNEFLSGDKNAHNYLVTREKAEAIYMLHKDTFDKYDMIITSDIAPLSRIFLQNNWKKPLLIWVCNRFDINCHRSGKKVFPDDNYHELFRAAKDMPNVEVIGYTAFEKHYAENYRNVHSITETITPVGMNTSHKGLYKSVPNNIDKESTIFVRNYLNERQVRLTRTLNNLGIKHYMGPYNGSSDIKDFKAMIHLPVVMSNLFLWENLSAGIVHLIPSKSFFADQYKKKLYFFDWTKYRRVTNNLKVSEIFEYCEWYRKDLEPLFVFFDSYEEIPHLLATTDFAAKKEAIAIWYNQFKRDTLAKWEVVFTRLADHCSRD